MAEIQKVKKWSPQPLEDFVNSKVSEPPIHTAHYAEEGIHIITPANFKNFRIDLDGTNKFNPAHLTLFKEFLLQEVSLVGDVGNACVLPKFFPPAITYRRTAHIKLKGINPHFVAAFLNHRAGDLQLKRMTRGVIQEQLRLKDSVEVLLPSWRNDVQNYIAEKTRLGVEMQMQSEYLTTAAKLLVEALIEGDLKESELKAAQEALQQGDNSRDQEILSQLTYRGYKFPGEPPLFPNLDALYETLKEVETSQEAE